MHFNRKIGIGNLMSDKDSNDDSSSDSSISEDSDDDSLDSSNSNNEDEDKDSNINNLQASTSTGEHIELDLNKEKDETVKAIIKSQDSQNNHPPAIIMEDFIVDLCFHPNENIIAVATITGDVVLYKYKNEETELKSTLELHLKACRDIEISNDGKTLFSTGKDLSVMLTDVETEKLVRVYEDAHEQPVYTMTMVKEHTFATGDDDGIVKMWDVRQKGSTPIFSLKLMEDYVSAMITNNDAKYLVCASGDGSLTTINMPEKKMHVQSEEYEEELTCLGLFKSETKILVGSNKGKMYVYNWGEFGLHSHEFPSLTKKAINCMIPITENIVITGGEDGTLRATSLFPNHHLGIVGQHSFPIEAVDINNDGTLIASVSHNNDIKFWNVQYFETLNINEPVKGGKQKQLKHNLPSSKVDNPSDFFADL